MNDSAAPITWGVDTGTIVTKFARQLAQHTFDGTPAGLVKFVFRYYRPGEITNPYGIQPAEAMAIRDAGMSLGVVFQGGKSSTTPGYFSPAQGTRDAEASLRKADQLRQPDGSAIYAAVDTDILNKTIGDVRSYFTAYRAGIVKRRPDLWVGAYGDDLVCGTLHAEGLIDCAWLANAKGWMTDRAFEGWVLRQGAQRTLPFGLPIDPLECRSMGGAGIWMPEAA